MKREMSFETSVFSLGDLPASGLAEICISGRSNVGKSSLINRIAQRKRIAKTSSRPGKTRSLNYYLVAGGYYFVDLPGYGYARVPKAERNLFSKLIDPYLRQRKELRGLIQLIDSRHGPIGGDLDMLEFTKNWAGEVLYVFTKVDKLNRKENEMLKRTCEKEFCAENTVLFSAVTGTGTEAVWAWVDRILGFDGTE